MEKYVTEGAKKRRRAVFLTKRDNGVRGGGGGEEREDMCRSYMHFYLTTERRD